MDRSLEDILKELLDNASFKSGCRIFLAADGRYVNTRGEYIDPYDLLVRFENLRDAVSRGRDLFQVIMAKQDLP